MLVDDNNDSKVKDDISIINKLCFHYKAKTKDSRLEIDLFTKKQREIAWTYKIPIAYFLFSLPSEKCVQKGYDYEILQKFLNKFKNILGIKNKSSFTPKKTLTNVWPNIHMLLYMSHISQYWKNKINELLGAKDTSQIIKLHKEVKWYHMG
ncbi:hypothetical protein RhiirC2_799343 [Rhizophagus irregularis]|uniref:Uncharacterized protein n=1 Tax=Rhizophagus irregularis TaxID=588596 RepID=A0A2N1M542_9GLOM|nr:hypothetical protein RhiirC2_799343 [Rhizophagus irregularis]